MNRIKTKGPDASRSPFVSFPRNVGSCGGVLRLRLGEPPDVRNRMQHALDEDDLAVANRSLDGVLVDLDPAARFIPRHPHEDLELIGRTDLQQMLEPGLDDDVGVAIAAPHDLVVAMGQHDVVDRQLLLGDERGDGVFGQLVAALHHLDAIDILVQARQVLAHARVGLHQRQEGVVDEEIPHRTVVDPLNDSGLAALAKFQRAAGTINLRPPELETRNDRAGLLLENPPLRFKKVENDMRAHAQRQLFLHQTSPSVHGNVHPGSRLPHLMQ